MFFDYSQFGQLNGCYSAGYLVKDGVGSVLASGSYCFPYMGVGVDGYQWINSFGRQLAISSTATGYQVPFNAKIGVAKLANDPNGIVWLVSAEDNSTDAFNASGALISHTLVNGKRVSYQYSTVSTPPSIAPYAGLPIQATDSFGRSVSYVYNPAGYVSQFIDPLKQVVQYGYDTASANCTAGTCNRLTSVTHQDGSRRTYQWNEPNLTGNTNLPNALTGVTDENGVRSASFTYDATGKAVATQRAHGADGYSITNRTDTSVTLRDPLGSDHVLGFTSILGGLYRTSTSQPAGVGNAASTTAQVFDASGNLTSADDFDQHRSCFTYDTTRNLETSRIEGLSTATACSAVTPVGAVLPAGARKTTTTWHPDWRLPVQIAEPGHITTLSYNGQGGVYCAPTTAVLPNGKPIAVLCKQVDQATTDADGHLGFAAVAQSGVTPRTSSFTYNANGQVLTATDPLNHTVTSTYYTDTSFTGTDPNAIGHAIGDQQTMKDAGGNITQYTQYDKNGRLLTSVDSAGNTTSQTYWPRGWLKTSTSLGQTTQYAYYPTGLLQTVTLPDTSTITYTYDDAHRLTGVADNLGDSITYTLDNAGNRTDEAVKDPSGLLQSQLDRIPDALNRIQQTTGSR